MSPRSPLSFVAVTCVAWWQLVGCADAAPVRAEPEPEPAPPGGAAPAPPPAEPAPSPASPLLPRGPYEIACNLYYKPGTGQGGTFSVQSDAAGTTLLAFPGYEVDFDYAPSTDPRSEEGILRVSERTSNVVQTYRLARQSPPRALFDGFTGIVFVGRDVSYVCKTTPAPAPLRSELVRRELMVGCDVELRTASGAIERQESFVPRRRDQEPVARVFGDLQLDVVFLPKRDEFEGGIGGITVWRGLGFDRQGIVSHLFQLHGSESLTNPIADQTFSGRGSVPLADGRELAYACSAR